VLPSLAIVAVLAVGGYVGWLGLSRMGIAPEIPAIATGGSSSDATDVPAVVTDTVAAPTPTIAPTVTPTPAPATPSPEPTPIPTPALVERVTGTVNTDAGVNARQSPSTDGELIRLVVKDEAMFVAEDQGDWLQVVLPDNTLAYVSSEFVTKSTDLITLDELNALRVAAGLEPLAPVAPAVPAVIVASMPVTITSDPGANARVEPLPESEAIMLVTTGTQLIATQRSADGKWVKVTLESGEAGWIVAEFLDAGDADLATLSDGSLAAVAPTPVVEPITATVPLSDTPAVTATTTITETPVITEPVVDPPLGLALSPLVPAEPFTNAVPVTGPAVSITATGGANARQTPGVDGAVLIVVPEGAVLPVVGRNADTTWLVVSLPDDQLAWVSREVVSLSDNVANAPVLDDGALTGEGTPGLLPSPPVTDTVELGEVPVVAPGDGPVATVSTLLGANTRPIPDQEAEAISQVNRGDSFAAVGRTEASDWVQIELADGTLAWLLASAVELDVDIAELPVVP
jgi:uncharacterized protein YgiM (DUF1202 family)